MKQLPQKGGGGKEWKPEVKPVGAMPSKPAQTGQTFTQTSLAANKTAVSTYICYIQIIVLVCMYVCLFLIEFSNNNLFVNKLCLICVL